LFATDPRTFEEMEDEVHGLLLRADEGSNVMSTRPVFYQGAPTMLVSLVRQYGVARVNLPSGGKFDNVATCVAEPLNSATRDNFKYGKKIWDWTDWSAEDLLWLLRYYGSIPDTFGIKLGPENNRQFLNLCMCLADEVVIIDTEESSYKNHLKTDDWSLMSYPPRSGGLLVGTSTESFHKAIRNHSKALFLVKGSSRERGIFKDANVKDSLRFEPMVGICGLFDVDWIGGCWPIEPLHHASFNGVLKVLYHIAKICDCKWIDCNEEDRLEQISSLWSDLVQLNKIPELTYDSAIGSSHVVSVCCELRGFPFSGVSPTEPKFHSGKRNFTIPLETTFLKPNYNGDCAMTEYLREDHSWIGDAHHGLWISTRHISPIVKNKRMYLADSQTSFVQTIPTEVPIIIGRSSSRPLGNATVKLWVNGKEHVMQTGKDMIAINLYLFLFLQLIDRPNPIRIDFLDCYFWIIPQNFSEGPFYQPDATYVEFHFAGGAVDITQEYFLRFLVNMIRWDGSSYYLVRKELQQVVQCTREEQDSPKRPPVDIDFLKSRSNVMEEDQLAQRSFLATFEEILCVGSWIIEESESDED